MAAAKRSGAAARSPAAAPAERPPAGPVIVRDPNIEFEPFKVLQRTDGPIVVHDTRAAPGQGTVAIFDFRGRGAPYESREDALKAASKEAERLAAAIAKGTPTP